jgi:hypothetical protein
MARKTGPDESTQRLFPKTRIIRGNPPTSGEVKDRMKELARVRNQIASLRENLKTEAEAKEM